MISGHGAGEREGVGGGEGAGGQFKTAWSFGKYMVSTASCRYSNLENNELVPHHFDLVQHMFHGIFLNQSEIYSVILKGLIQRKKFLKLSSL